MQSSESVCERENVSRSVWGAAICVCGLGWHEAANSSVRCGQVTSGGKQDSTFGALPRLFRKRAAVKCKGLSRGQKGSLITAAEATFDGSLSLCKKQHCDGDLLHLTLSTPHRLRLQLLQAALIPNSLWDFKPRHNISAQCQKTSCS